ncbi:MAG: hypothetical protein KY393_03840 [Actinobacteria bacterium]|nr:hypothetical protein [Actinomycetota bacterium]
MTTEQAGVVGSANRPARASRFLYEGYEIDWKTDRLICRYRLDDRLFQEIISVKGLGRAGAAGREAARLVFLLAGVSYYKAGAPPVIDLGSTEFREPERQFLAAFYTEGLGEFALRNGIELNPQIVGGVDAGAQVRFSPGVKRPLVPFGGGLDSIVTVEAVRALQANPSLFVVSSGRQSFAAIDEAAAVSGLPMVTARRELDPDILRPAPGERFNGHVPITGIISSIAVLAAVLGGHDAVIMSNEWSASVGNTEVNGRQINHQYSKSVEFENSFREVLRGAFDAPPEYFSLLRSWSTLSIAERFATLTAYHPVFHSCNRAFHVDPRARMPKWCGICDKCCFVDLVLASVMSSNDLSLIFDGREPLQNPDLVGQFVTLLGLSERGKPFECVGDVQECRAALLMAVDRSDRRNAPVVQRLHRLLRDSAATASVEGLLQALGPNNVPDTYAAAADLG